MTVAEREMIYEVNRLRSDPASYLQYIDPLLKEAQKHVRLYGKGEKNYSLTFTRTVENGKEVKTIDTTWNFYFEEELKALTSLAAELRTLKPVSVLQPDSGIYLASCKHAADQNQNDWKLMHTGTDGSSPQDRVKKFSPAMQYGGENIAGSTGNDVTVRDIVLQLLIDSGIPGYGHRRTLLNPKWTHIACKGQYVNNLWNWWIQNFGTVNMHK